MKPKTESRILDDIRARIDLVELVGETVKLKRSGKNYMGLCPFHIHKNNTPSFSVNPETGRWRCFGQCNEGGNAFDFIMKRDGLEFGNALRVLAERAGVKLESTPAPTGDDGHLDRLRALLETAATYYAHLLKNSPDAQPAREHLTKRGLLANAIEAFQIGYAPNGWETTAKYLAKAGYTRPELLAAGLLTEKEEGRKTYDRFRHRLMLPVRDERGRMVGFQARALDDTQQPKFLNSPHTPLFEKGRILFGLHLARKAIKQAGHAVVVEGNLDVVAAHQAGFTNVVSSQGTAITEHQMRLLKKHAPRVLLCLDGDSAGATATLRALDVARASLDRSTDYGFDPRGLLKIESRLTADIRVMVLPPDTDPDDIVLRDPGQWRSLEAQAAPLVSHIIAALTAGHNLADPKTRVSLATTLLPFIEEVPSAIERTTYRQQLAAKLGINEPDLHQLLKPTVTELAPPAVEPSQPAPASLDLAPHLSAATALLAQIQSALAADQKDQAEALGQQLRTDRAALPEPARVPVQEALLATINTAPGETQSILYELCGLTLLAPTATNLADDFILLGLFNRAKETENPVARAQLIEQAARLIAAKPESVAPLYKERFAELGYRGSDYKNLLRVARTHLGGSRAAEVKNGSLHWQDEPVVNADIRIIEEQFTDDGLDEPQCSFLISGQLSTGEKLPDITVLAEDFRGCKWLAKYGARVITSKGPSNDWLVAKAIQLISLPTIQRKKVFVSGGWHHLNGEWAYLSASGAITKDGLDTTVSVNLGEQRMNYYCLPQPPEPNVARASVHMALDLLRTAPLTVTAPMFACLHAALLCDVLPFNGILWIHGRTGSRKTSLLMAMLTAYGPQFIKGREVHTPAAWEYSVPRLEPLWYAAKDMPLVIDNYRPAQDRVEEAIQRKKVEQVSHLIGDRNARGRAQHNGLIRKSKPPRGIIISTSELPFAGESNTRRMFSVLVGPQDVNNALLEKAQSNGEHGFYAEATSAFIQWRIRNWETVAAQIASDRALAIGVAKRHGVADGRILDYCVVLLVTSLTYLQFAQDMGAITQPQARAKYVEMENAIITLALSQQARAENQSPLIRICEALASQVEQGNAFIIPRVGGQAPFSEEAVIGYYEERKDTPHNVLYLYPPACIKVAMRHWQDQGTPLNINSEVLGRDLDQSKLLLARTPDGYCVSKWTGRFNKKVLMVDADGLFRATSVDLWPPRISVEAEN